MVGTVGGMRRPVASPFSAVNRDALCGVQRPIDALARVGQLERK
jgi:hypothetical protein